MIEAVGTDIIEIERIEQAIARHKERFLRLLFTEKEIVYCQKYADPMPHFAGRFAAKEAILKALGTGLTKEIHWLDLEILNDVFGKPEVHLSQTMRKNYPRVHILLSISHCRAYATATALLRRQNE